MTVSYRSSEKVKQIAGWLTPNAILIAIFCYWKLHGSEWAYNLLIFYIWCCIVFGFLVFLVVPKESDAIRRIADSPVPLSVKSMFFTLYLITLVAMGWFWTAGFYCAAELMVVSLVLSVRKSREIK